MVRGVGGRQPNRRRGSAGCLPALRRPKIKIQKHAARYSLINSDARTWHRAHTHPGATMPLELGEREKLTFNIHASGET